MEPALSGFAIDDSSINIVLVLLLLLFAGSEVYVMMDAVKCS